MKNSVTRDFISYDYLSVDVTSDLEAMYIDCYQNFGWVLTSNVIHNEPQDYYINNYKSNEKKLINIKFKRDRKIKNKVKLNEYQKKMEYAFKEIQRLENEPNRLGTMYSLIVSFIGTVFMAISVFCITAQSPLYFLCVINGIIGMIGWALPYFIYKGYKTKKEEINKSLIEKQYDIVYDNCEKANNLID